MNTSSISVSMTTATVDRGMLRRPTQDFIARRKPATLKVGRAVLCPPLARRATECAPYRVAAKRATSSVWLSLPRETGAEKILLGCLVLAAGAAIAYGFVSLLDYVQHWAAINAWVARLLSA
jgi:hypothetical protein